MADPKAPDLFQRLLAFMREADEWGTPADVLRSAEEAGLAIVSEADRKVLEACAGCQDRYLQLHAQDGMGSQWVAGVAEAELARRSGT